MIVAGPPPSEAVGAHMTAHLTELGKHVRDEAALRNSVLPQISTLISGESSFQNLSPEMVDSVKEMMIRASVGTVQQLIPSHFEPMWQCANILSPQKPTEAEGGPPVPPEDAKGETLDGGASVSSQDSKMDEPSAKVARVDPAAISVGA